MGECILQTGGAGLNLKGIVEQYNVYTQEKISAGNFVQFVEGLNGGEEKASVVHALAFNLMQGIGYKNATKLVLIASDEKTNLFYAAVVTLNPIDDSVTMGTVYTRSFNYTNCYRSYNVATLSSDETNGITFVADIAGGDSGGNNYNPSYIALTVNDADVITFGTPVKIAHPVYCGQVSAVNDTICFAYFSYNGGNPTVDQWIMPMSLSGNVITMGSKFVITSTYGYDFTRIVSTAKISNSAILLFGLSASDPSTLLPAKKFYAYLTFSGISPTLSSFSNSNVALNDSTGGDRIVGSVVLSSSLGVVFEWIQAGLFMRKFSIVNLILTFSKAVRVPQVGDTFTNSIPTMTFPLDSNRFLAFCQYGSGKLVLMKITSSELLILDEVPHDIQISATGTSSIISSIGDGRFVVVLPKNTGMGVNTRFFKIIGDKILFETLSYVRERQVKKALSRPFDGVAKNAGEGGTRTEIKDTIKIVTL